MEFRREEATADVVLRSPMVSTHRMGRPSQHILQLHPRSSPKLRALEIPP